jgi:hypothetical protein
MKVQFTQHKVEPNSGLGEAISHMQKNWEGLTRFLHVAGTWKAFHVSANQQRPIMRRRQRTAAILREIHLRRASHFGVSC